MGDTKHYVIRGGIEGRERLRVLSRIMRETTASLLDRLDLRDGQRCLDVGCGGGDVTLELARPVAPRGAAVGADIDETKLALARQEARELGVANVEFRQLDVRDGAGAPEFDLVHARFLLTHLGDPAGAVKAVHRHVRPGGMVALADVDFSGHFAHPESAAFRRFHELYCTVVRRRGLYAIAADDHTLGGVPRVVQAWGRRPAAGS